MTEQEFPISVDTAAVHSLTVAQAWHYRIFPASVSADGLELYCEENAELLPLAEELEVLMGKPVVLRPVAAAVLARLLNQYYLKEEVQQGAGQLNHDAASDSFLEQLIGEAKRLKSSDIHVERYEEKCRVRIRIDGTLVERYLLSKSEYPAIINRIKILSGLDIAEKRLPQDGRINFKTEQQQFDIRVSVLPTLYGEKVVLRLLSNDAANIDLFKLGFSETDLGNYLDGVRRPNGMVLISGPTGSGKTTTLYATLKLLNQTSRNILTIEDPVEYTLDGINQVQLKENIGLSFAAALRTFLRQDPDVIMVGEIRDPETANMAIRAALTGHLVLSTIHTNSALGTVSRLVDMGIPAFLVASTLNTSVAQRLLRLLCPACKMEADFEGSLYPRGFRAPYAVERHFLNKGCDQCYHTGYRGRKAVYEVVPVDRELGQLIKQGSLTEERYFEEAGIPSIGRNAFELFASGLTTLEEVYPLLLN